MGCLLLVLLQRVACNKASRARSELFLRGALASSMLDL